MRHFRSERPNRIEGKHKEKKVIIKAKKVSQGTPNYSLGLNNNPFHLFNNNITTIIIIRVVLFTPQVFLHTLLLIKIFILNKPSHKITKKTIIIDLVT